MVDAQCLTFNVLANNIDTLEIFTGLIFSVRLPERHLNKESIRILKDGFLSKNWTPLSDHSELIFIPLFPPAVLYCLNVV